MTTLVEKLFGLPFRGRLALVALALHLIFSLVLFKQVTAKYETQHESLIPRLQKAWSGDEFKLVLEEWSVVNERAAEIYKRDNLIKLDLLFPLIYSSYFAFAYAWARKVKTPTGRWDYIFFLVPFCAALFDYFEDGMHLYLLRGINTREQVEAASFPDALVHLSAFFSFVKFFFLSIGSVAYIFAFFKRFLD